MSLIRGAGSMPAIEITRQDLSISQLRAAARAANAKQARRILAIAMVLDGHSRRLAAEAGGMERQTLRDWVHRYNADGLAGLADRPRPGRRPRLAEAQRSEVAAWVEDGPDLKTDGVGRWRWADLRDRIAAKFHVHLHERSVGKLRKKLNFSSMPGRPLHPQSDLEAQDAFKKTSPARQRAAIPRELAGRRSKIWFQDEPSIRHSKALRALELLAHSARVGKRRHADPHLGEAGQRFRQAKPVGMAGGGLPVRRHLQGRAAPAPPW
jgi:transposase